jgi:hypothetical protein
MKKLLVLMCALTALGICVINITPNSAMAMQDENGGGSLPLPPPPQPGN